MKFIFKRTRPHERIEGERQVGYSYPSGHSAVGVSFYTTLGYISGIGLSRAVGLAHVGHGGQGSLGPLHQGGPGQLPEEGGDGVLPAALNAHGLAEGAEHAGQARLAQGAGGVLSAQ